MGTKTVPNESGRRKNKRLEDTNPETMDKEMMNIGRRPLVLIVNVKAISLVTVLPHLAIRII